MILGTKQGIEITMTDGFVVTHTPLQDGKVRLAWWQTGNLIKIEAYILSDRAWRDNGNPSFYPLVQVRKIEITGPPSTEP